MRAARGIIDGGSAWLLTVADTRERRRVGGGQCWFTDFNPIGLIPNPAKTYTLIFIFILVVIFFSERILAVTYFFGYSLTFLVTAVTY